MKQEVMSFVGVAMALTGVKLLILQPEGLLLSAVAAVAFMAGIQIVARAEARKVARGLKR